MPCGRGVSGVAARLIEQVGNLGRVDVTTLYFEVEKEDDRRKVGYSKERRVDPDEHPASWRAVWAYSTKRAVRDNRTLTLQENRAKEVVAGEKSAKAPRFVKNAGGAQVVKVLDEVSLARARRLVGLTGYVTNIPSP
ncbi:hypothetical protein [Nocardioides sp.]|uniref:hypothetical protein n=1 Tax=Nocardioides sp. TaxID=35761 RepID=UPI0039E3D1DB